MLNRFSLEKNINSKGFFIEAGAGDGEIISNSLYFELKYEVKCRATYYIRVKSVIDM